MAQLECPASDAPHPFTTVKSPVVWAAINVSGTSPELESVTVCTALAVFNCCAAKMRLGGVRESVAAVCPIPLSAAVCVPALSVMLKVPVRVPDAVGANATPTVQPAYGASVTTQVFAVIAKSPVSTGNCSTTLTPPVFEMVMFCGELVVPRFVAGNVTETGFNTTAPGGRPVPLSCAVAWPPATLP